MSSNFAFPPPPPPPPKPASTLYPPYPQLGYSHPNRVDARRTRGGGSSSFQGRGDRQRGFYGNGYGQRDHVNLSAERDRGNGSVPYTWSSAGSGEKYSGQQRTSGPTSYPLPQYPQSISTVYNGGSSPYVNVAPQPTYGNGYGPQTWTPPQTQSAPYHTQPSIMGPPIRMGFDQKHPPDFRSSENNTGPSVTSHVAPRQQFLRDTQAGRHLSSNTRLPNKHLSPNPFPGNKHHDSRSQQRRRSGNFHGDSFRPRESRPHPSAAPPVPNFGGPLPSLIPIKDDETKKPRKKKKRTHNVLGLTPRQIEHEESEEEDLDEEAILGGNLGTNQAQLQVTYNGQTAILKTSTDIAAWIEERKKRFPTKERVEARKAELKRRSDKANSNRKAIVPISNKPGRETVDPKQLALQARSKMEKARKKLERELENLTRAEAAAANAEASNGDQIVGSVNGSKKRKRQGEHEEESGEHGVDTVLARGASESPRVTAHADLTGNMNNSSPIIESADSQAVVDSDGVREDDMSISSSSAVSDEEETSSSGSSSGSSSSEDEPPDQAPSKTGLPQRVPPPDRVKRSGICRAFAKTGQCKFKDKCYFSHDAPDKKRSRNGNVSNSSRKGGEIKEKQKRKGLYQRFVESDKAKEDLLVIEAIKHLAENGVIGTGVDGAPSTLQSE